MLYSSGSNSFTNGFGRLSHNVQYALWHLHMRCRWWWWVPLVLLLVVGLQALLAVVHHQTVERTSSTTVMTAYLTPPSPLRSEDDPSTSQPQPSPHSSPRPSPVVEVAMRVHPHEAVNSYDAQQGVAFAIPVGGRTERSESLSRILDRLLQGGALPTTIFVFEDVLSRWNGQASPAVLAVCKQRGVQVVESVVERTAPEDYTNFGIGLARHYHFFLDFLLADQNVPHVKSRVLRNKPFDFTVVIEDDLELAPDTVKYFLSMARVMLVDDTLYCAAAHQDNAFLGIHRDDDVFESSFHHAKTLSADGFDFRRGNHFMAPGWMTSRSVYIDIVRPKWLNANLEYSHKNELHLRNGHWDRFFDSMIGKKDCIFPELPRITHQGADGFTVSKRGQMELYSNLRLSVLPVDVNYGDLSRLTYDGYIRETEAFIHSAKLLSVLEEARKYRQTNLVYVVDCEDDKDEEWNAVFNHYFGLIGVGGYGGHEGYVKVRGIFRGAVFVRWLTNIVLLVGSYSPYMNSVRAVSSVPFQEWQISYVGCYIDTAARDLLHQVKHYTVRSLTPQRCLASCQMLGYQYAGLQRFECWCGSSYGKHGESKRDQCDHSCGNRGFLSSLFISSSSKINEKNPMECGGGWRNSVYTNVHPDTKTIYQMVLKTPSNIQYIKGRTGQSCDEACRSFQYRCDERYFPLIHRSCMQLSQIFGEDCTNCFDEEEPERGFATPAWDPVHNSCLMSRARYHRCNWQPPSPLLRACVCVP